MSPAVAISPLHIAARNGHTSIVDTLLKANVDPDSQLTELKITPLIFAVQQGHLQVARSLLAGKADINLEQPNRVNAVVVAAACEKDNPEVFTPILEYLISQGASVPN